jgi:hypothetical protein
MTVKKIFIVIIYLILVAPVLGTIIGFPIGKPVQKGKVKFPSISEFQFKEQRVEYVFKVAKWFDANNAFEGFYVRFWNQIRWTFGVSHELIKGEDGWVVDKKTAYEQLPDSDKISDVDLQKTIELIKRLQNYLNTKGIKFAIVIVPFKSTVYAEKFVNAGVRIRTNTGLDRFQKAFSLNDIPYVDAQAILREKKATPVFYKTDLHFNTYGGYLVAHKILEHFYRELHVAMPEFNEPVMALSKFSAGSDRIATPLLFESEMAELVPTVGVPSKFTKKSEPIKSGQPPAEIYTADNPGVNLLPPSIMFGNSYMLTYEGIGYHNYFSKSARVLDYQYFQKALDYLEDDTKIFILQLYETQILFHLPHNNEYSYWDKRIYDLPLPENYKYVASK